MIDEKAYRRDTFDAGRSAPVTLCDGGEWFIPLPTTFWRAKITTTDDLFRPQRVEGSDVPTYEKVRKLVMTTRTGYDDRINETLAKLETALAVIFADAAEGPTTEETVSLMFDLAVQLIARNYDLPDELWPNLIEYNETTGEHAPMFARILSIARGHVASPVKPSYPPPVEV